MNFAIAIAIAIATAKDAVDDLVMEAAQAFNGYLFAYNTKSNIKIPVVHHLLNEAKQAGFSVISAEKVCLADKEPRNKNGRELVERIETEITAKIISMQNPFKSLFFTKAPEATPSQKHLLDGFIGFDKGSCNNSA